MKRAGLRTTLFGNVCKSQSEKLTEVLDKSHRCLCDLNRT